jgi:hypothetical protein
MQVGRHHTVGKRHTVEQTKRNFVSSFSLVSLNRTISFNFVSFYFRDITVSRNTKFREMAHLFREITKFISVPFHEIYRYEIALEILTEPHSDGSEFG